MADRLWPECPCMIGEGQSAALLEHGMTIAQGASMHHVQTTVSQGFCPSMSDAILANSVALSLTASVGEDPQSDEVYRDRLEKFIGRLRVAALMYTPEEGRT